MNPHDYTPEQALELLLQKLDERIPEVAAQVRRAIAEGKEEDIVSDDAPGRKNKKTRSYRQKVPLSLPEALAAAVQVLRAHLIEVPLFINSAHENFTLTTLQSQEIRGRIETRNEAKAIQVEQVPETALNLENQPEVVPIKPFGIQEIQEQQEQLQQLEELFHF